jgi:glutamate synthase (NADPH/NADH) small chain
MGKATGFLEIDRKDRTYTDPKERLTHYKEFIVPHSADALKDQASRCMNCGIPYCHNGCPVNNIIPDWNHLVYEGDWQNALEVLHSTNNFPEFTGRICPAPCEASVHAEHRRFARHHQVDRMRDCGQGLAEQGWIDPAPAFSQDRQIGGGCRRLGRQAWRARSNWRARAIAVTLFEKNDRMGGLLRYGIPDFKMEKQLINRRLHADGSRRRCAEDRHGNRRARLLRFACVRILTRW